MGRDFWRLVESQHGVVSRSQLLEMGLSGAAIQHRVSRGRLHPVWRGVYAVGRPDLSQEGLWLGAVLACGPRALLSHASAAALWGFGRQGEAAIEVSVPAGRHPRRPGIVAYRRSGLVDADRAWCQRMPVIAPARTLLDLAATLPETGLEAAINEADRLGLLSPEQLRTELPRLAGARGVAAVRAILDRRSFRLTDSELERHFLRLVDSAGISRPLTGRALNGFKVDFHWPELGLIVETDGLRYHRTATQQARDHERDQAHAAAGLTCLRFTHAQVRFEADRVRDTLVTVARRLGGRTK